MKVAVDTNGMYTTQAGVARYIRGLLKGLGEIRAPDLEFFRLAWPVTNFEYRQPLRAMKTLYREMFWLNFVAPQILRRQKADLVHGTGSFRIGRPGRVGLVATVHDLGVVRHPERYRPWTRWMTGRFLQTVGGARRIICISRFTADELISEYGVEAGRIDVVYHGSDFDPAGAEKLERPPGTLLPESFFLFVGSLEPGKNLALLVEAYRQAEKQGIELPPLVVVGARWEGVAREDPPPASWVYLGQQSDEVLAWLYRRALALVFPTRYEGFGLPLLEAMSLGCPVLCSRLASLPEVGGEAVRYCEQRPDSYLRAMTELVKSPGLREQHIQAGFTQAKKFSWSNCAEMTVETYRKALRS